MNDEFDEMMGESYGEMSTLLSSALMLKELFDSHIKVGFSEENAIEMIKASIIAASQGPR